MARKVVINTTAANETQERESAAAFLNFSIRLKDGNLKRISTNGLPIIESHKVGGSLLKLIREGKINEENLLDLLTVNIHLVDSEASSEVEIDI